MISIFLFLGVVVDSEVHTHSHHGLNHDKDSHISNHIPASGNIPSSDEENKDCFIGFHICETPMTKPNALNYQLSGIFQLVQIDILDDFQVIHHYLDPLDKPPKLS